MEKKRISCDQARDMDMVDYLAGLGIQPSKIRGNDFWYLSPFRSEKTPSFKINRKLNRWFDFGEGVGGNLIDFAIRFNHCTIGEFLRSLNGESILPQRTYYFKAEDDPVSDNPITILREFCVSSYPLLDYLNDRRIPFVIADRFCREVRYQIGDRCYYAIGFKNDSGGWEIRNKHFKGSSSPKDIKTITTGGDTVCVFEGFMDFLSFMVICENAGIDRVFDYLILNSLSLFEKSRAFLEKYQHIHLYLDNDPAGKHCCDYAMSLDDRYCDKSDLYKNYKDLNEFLCFPGNLNCREEDRTR